MFFQKFSRKYIDFSIRKRMKNVQRRRQFSNLKDISKVILLFSVNTISNKELEDIKKMIGMDKQISAWAFKSRNTKVAYGINTYTIDKNDISFFQKPSEKIEKLFLNNKSELLIDLTTQEILPLKYLLGISKALCRCGMKKEGYTLYDLEIEAPAKMKETELLKQILYYLDIIKTKS